MNTLCLLIVGCSFGSALIPSSRSSKTHVKQSTQRVERLGNSAIKRGSQLRTLNTPNDTNKIPRGGSAYTPAALLSSIKLGYEQRVAADPSFLSKSILEIILAAATQYTAEVGRRGGHRILPEIDFVAAGVLTAVFGKYYSMWRVAKTVVSEESDDNKSKYTGNNKTGDSKSSTSWRDTIPTNAFQPTLLDGRTKPNMSSRFMAILLPMPELFRAGVIASAIGYGLTAIMIQLRTILVPEYVMPTVPVPLIGASIYTGVFMAIVSNVRYQLLQGIVEPYMIEEPFLRIETLGESLRHKQGFIGCLGILLRWSGWNRVKGLIIASVRWANGLLGSWIAIGGMRRCGLQKLKS
ncbi:hypothetical protein ACHAWO_013437 [Cyclotella atomus]|uniref:ADP,ATP carrier protein n=1 Tax=Cyclotella atomus TaxID=382360 RepID=A0ABD3NSY5_9STRA